MTGCVGDMYMTRCVGDVYMTRCVGDMYMTGWVGDVYITNSNRLTHLTTNKLQAYRPWAWSEYDLMSLCVRKYEVYHMYRTRRYIAMGMHLTRLESMGMHLTRLESMRFFASTRRDSPKSKRRDLCVYSICLQGIGCLTLDALLLGPSLKQQKPKFESWCLQGIGCLQLTRSLS